MGKQFDAGSFALVVAQALILKVREGNRTLGIQTLIATRVNTESNWRLVQRLLYAMYVPETFEGTTRSCPASADLTWRSR